MQGCLTYSAAIAASVRHVVTRLPLHTTPPAPLLAVAPLEFTPEATSLSEAWQAGVVTTHSELFSVLFTLHHQQSDNHH